MDEETDYINPEKFIGQLPESIRLGFSKYYEQNNEKLSPNNFYKVLDEVQKEKKKFIPKGSAQTTLPNLINIDNEIKYIRNKNKEFQDEIDKAISKLNFGPIPGTLSPGTRSPIRNREKLKPIRITRRDNKQPSLSPENTYIISILIPSPTQNSTVNSLPSQDRNLSGILKHKESGLENAYLRSRRNNDSKKSYIHISTTPEPTLTSEGGLSPQPHNKSFDNSVITRRTSRLKQFNNVVEKCESLRPTLRSQLPELQQKYEVSNRSRKEVMRNICDLEECLSVAKDMESLQDMMAIKKYNKKAEREMLTTIREMMEVKSSHRAHPDKSKKHKIWKYSIGNLLKRTERLLYSIPKSL